MIDSQSAYTTIKKRRILREKVRKTQQNKDIPVLGPGLTLEVPLQGLPVLHHPGHEQVAVFSPRVLSSGHTYYLHLEFGAELTESFYGFYKSSYKNGAGETR